MIFTRHVSPLKQSRSAYAMIFLAVLVVILGIIGASFNRQASDTRFITRRHGQSYFVRSFAETAAHFTLIKLQHELAENPLHELSRDFFHKSLVVADDAEIAIAIDEYQSVLAPMIEALEHEGDFSYTIKVKAQKENFGPTYYSDRFPAEKSGFIDVVVETNLRGVSEQFYFIAPVKVTSSLLPALSKFSFYLKNAAPANNDLYFNKISNDFRGSLMSGSPKPLVFNNGSISPQNITWENIVNGHMGLIFLGDGDVRLNISASTGSDVSDFGESFHFFRRSKPRPDTPFYLYEDLREPPLVDSARGDQPTLMLRYDLGLSEMSGDNPLRNILAQVFENAEYQYQDGHEEYLKSSVLRLFGADGKVSPTLVLGSVYRGFLSISAARVVPPGYPRNELFIYPRDLIDFNERLSLHGPGQVARLLYPAPRTHEHIDRYRTEHASGVAYQPYNLSLGYVATRNLHAGPISEVETFCEKLAAAMSHDLQGSLANIEALTLPSELEYLANGNELADLLELFDEPGATPEEHEKSRFAWVIDLAENELDLTTVLNNAGLIIDGEFTSAGWIFFKNSPPQVNIEQPLKVTANGGMVFDGPTTLSIKGTIDSQREDGSYNILTLVCLDGDINLDTPRVDASMIAPQGRVLFSREVTVNGSLIMRDFDVDQSFPGGELNYNPALALQPHEEAFARTLSVTIRTTPLVIN